MTARAALAGLAAALPAVACLAQQDGRQDGRLSGSAFMSAETREMQADDAANPGMLSVLDGEALWSRKEGAAGRACADCHSDAATSMRGVAARFPAFDAARNAPVNLDQRINICRAEKQGAAPFAWESPEILALSAYVGLQSRGLPITAGEDPRLAPFIERGRGFYSLRQGQLDLACASCHDDNWGRLLGSSPIPQAHPTGYPIYRLEWQGMGSLQRRLRNCLAGVRAEPFAYGAPEYVELELFLMTRAHGMVMETPAVRP
ncbi:sulfur oxidation c-type cytochrome SoxA [Arenibaculum pallidiluteum]|uniref:sulfur oxidation c-type cytochrome SoxA n=1 Tax=Arenibaculum pallidiluteum TaxID=2812559 RepID=UPI001F175EBC|nr:sulfur oxidation c-type cytochrome SoxA [Arenibaculum pallidiluteum]